VCLAAILSLLCNLLRKIVLDTFFSYSLLISAHSSPGRVDHSYLGLSSQWSARRPQELMAQV
jgi:hypothetical protein